MRPTKREVDAQVRLEFDNNEYNYHKHIVWNNRYVWMGNI
jgi:hypothetical protein